MWPHKADKAGIKAGGCFTRVIRCSTAAEVSTGLQEADWNSKEGCMLLFCCASTADAPSHGTPGCRLVPASTAAAACRLLDCLDILYSALLLSCPHPQTCCSCDRDGCWQDHWLKRQQLLSKCGCVALTCLISSSGYIHAVTGLKTAAWHTCATLPVLSNAQQTQACLACGSQMLFYQAMP